MKGRREIRVLREFGNAGPQPVHTIEEAPTELAEKHVFRGLARMEGEGYRQQQLADKSQLSPLVQQAAQEAAMFGERMGVRREVVETRRAADAAEERARQMGINV